MSNLRLVVTGGCGFIGSAFVRKFYKECDLIVVDKLTYAGNRKHIRNFADLVYDDICNYESLRLLCQNFRPDAIVNFAAESHVDRSINNDNIFLKTNTEGVLNLLHIVKELKISRFLQVSTDEVYGSISQGVFFEDDKMNPRNAYSASKAAAENFCNAYYQTHGVDVVITRGSNTYGPRQYPEKLIPLAIKRLDTNRSIPVYGEGLQVRDWLYVDDHVNGIMTALQKGDSGEIYNISGEHELKNIDLISILVEKYSQFTGYTRDSDCAPYYEFVTDRKGHDFRYAMDCSKLRELGWGPKTSFDTGLDHTFEYYMKEEYASNKI